MRNEPELTSTGQLPRNPCRDTLVVVSRKTKGRTVLAGCNLRRDEESSLNAGVTNAFNDLLMYWLHF